MFHLPEHYHYLSLRLSEVLDDIGVNQRMVQKRRRLVLLWETSLSLSSGFSVNIFGSRSEGTTTTGLKSDTDLLFTPNNNVIQDYAEWKPGVTNLLMIQDDKTSPGYCHLQLIRPDMPLPFAESLEHCLRDTHGRLLLKNTFFDNINMMGIKNGPAMTREGDPSLDFVFAFSCASWPVETRDWALRGLRQWPTEGMKKYAEDSGCFVVPVESKVSQVEKLEWRISTSKAERCLMYNLNITQIRCFVLLKMILKTYPLHPVSSYMCKTVLLRCIEKTHYSMWQDQNLLKCLTVCLQALYCSILQKSCPHFFIPGNNLMARKFSPRLKAKLLKSLHYILEGQEAVLYGIQIDDLGERLEIKINPLIQSVRGVHLPSANIITLFISGNIIFDVARDISSWTDRLLAKRHVRLKSPISISEELVRLIANFVRLYKNGTNIERKTLQLLVPSISSSLGSVLASINIGTNQTVSPEALRWLAVGLNSDVSSGRLKLASVLYCVGDMLLAELILRDTERLYRLDCVEPVCGCNLFTKQKAKTEYMRVCYIENEKAVNSVSAFCVKFFPAEMYSIPRELQYELFRTTEQERMLHRYNHVDLWMEMVVVDSLPLLYFLQYKTYGNLQCYNDQQRALENLAIIINSGEDFRHRETALNLLGQCMEEENRLNDALVCYASSLNVRETNNVARFHLCRLLADMQNNL